MYRHVNEALDAGLWIGKGMKEKERTVQVGGAPMYPSKNIIENAVNSKDHTTLVAAVKAAGLVETLSSAGPFTVFAPTNAAFDKLPKGTVDNLLKPESKQALTGVSFTSPQQLRGAIDKFVSAYNKSAAPFEWTKAVVHPTAPKRKYADLCK